MRFRSFSSIRVQSWALRQPALSRWLFLISALLTCVPWPVISVITLEYTSHHRHQENPQVSRQLVKEEKSKGWPHLDKKGSTRTFPRQRTYHTSAQQLGTDMFFPFLFFFLLWGFLWVLFFSEFSRITQLGNNCKNLNVQQEDSLRHWALLEPLLQSTGLNPTNQQLQRSWD